MSPTDPQVPAITVKEVTAPPPSPPAAGAGSIPSERPNNPLSSVANTANQILFKNELYTSMKQKTMDQELMTTLNREAQGEEKRRFEKAKLEVARLENKRKVLIGVGDMVGPPGSDPSSYSSASIAVDLSPNDTVRDVKKKLISVASWQDELPEDFGLFDDVSEEPLRDAIAIESALAGSSSKPAAAGRGAGGRRGAPGGWSRPPASIRLPRPYVGMLWAARPG